MLIPRDMTPIGFTEDPFKLFSILEKLKIDMLVGAFNYFV